jgi:two-component system OmpR family sensor kinase
VRVRTYDGQALLEVADEGPGLPPGDEGLVFERFYRADAARARTGGSGSAGTMGTGGSGGTGLGLSIVAAIVTAHGGTVHAGAPPSGRGAYFLVALPIAPPAAPEPNVTPSDELASDTVTLTGQTSADETWAPPAILPPRPPSGN